MPRWHAPATLAGRRILLRAEQGLGDALQFIRYAPLVAARGAHVVVEVAPALAGLVARVDGVAAVSTWGDPPPAADYQCPLMSLPYEFGTTLATVPGTVPYLRADEQRCAHWRARLSAERRPKVGLVWSGGLHRNQPDCAASSARRNIALAELAALRHPGIAYYSLQKGAEAEAELATAVAAGWSGPPMTDFTTELRDFDDTAALVENLDLVISVDTSTAHLAGALGKPVWVLNRHDTCWRWLLDRTDSPWYPTLRLFRQPRRQDWGAVVDSVRTALHQWLSRPPA